MNKQLSTKLYKLDFKELIDNATNKVYWGKQWEIFKYSDHSIVFSLSSINIINNKLYGRIELVHKKKYYYSNIQTVITIPLQKDNFNKKALEKELCGKVDELFLTLSEYKISYSNEYIKLEALEEKLKDNLKNIANNFLDENNVTNEDIREVYIDNYVYNNSKSLTNDYKIENRYNNFVEHRVTFCYIMNFKEKAENIIKKSNKTDCGWILEEAEELRKIIEDENFEEFEGNLEEL